MKQAAIIFTSLVVSFSSYAQGNATEAKAACLFAEESYGKADYKDANNFLHQAKTRLGSSDCKLLYLQIMVTCELHPKDVSSGEKVLALINEFEKSPAFKDFNEEKILEVTKLKLSVSSEVKTQAEQQKQKESGDKVQLLYCDPNKAMTHY
jgi:hypothetical protein